MKSAFVITPLTFTLILFFFMNGGSAFAQQEFPVGWQGRWSGELRIFYQNGEKVNVPMKLNILPTESPDTFIYQLQYTGQEMRDYRLICLDKENGHYVIDEQNSIVLDAWLIGDELLSSFSVEDSQLQTSLALKGDHLVWKVVSQSLDDYTGSGGAEHQGQPVPEVRSYLVTSVQRAELKKLE